MSQIIKTGIPRCARLSLLLQQAEMNRLGLNAELVYDEKSHQHGLLVAPGAVLRAIRLSEIQQIVLQMTGQEQPCPAVLETDTNPQIEMTAVALFISFTRQAVKGTTIKPKTSQHKLVWTALKGWECQSSELVDRPAQAKMPVPPKVTSAPRRRSALFTHRPGTLCGA